MQQQTHNDIDKLNPEQRQAVTHIEGPALVLAGAGSGKTRVVTLRIANLISQGVPYDRILAVTFTNKAAGEMKARVERLCNKQVLVATFHSLGSKILREEIQHLGMSPQFAIYDEEDTGRLLKAACKEVYGLETKVEIKQVSSFISYCKNRLLKPEQVPAKDTSPGLIEVYSCYIKKLKECNAVDFDDLLFLPVQLFEEHPDVLQKYQERFAFVLVDEYQDTNFSQSRMIQLITAKEKNLFVVGDPDQSIYSWRGAHVENILRFDKEYPGAAVIKLQQNYRSTETILQAANSVIKHNSNRFEKALWSAKGAGERISLLSADTERKEAEFIAHKIYYLHGEGANYSDIAVLYRTNFQSRSIEDMLISLKIPYKIIGGISFYLRKEVKDILSFLRLLQNGADEVSFLRVVNLPKRGLGEALLSKLSTIARERGVSLLDLVCAGVETNFQGFECSISAKQKEGLSQFVRVMNLLKAEALVSVPDAVRAAVYQSGYLSVLDSDPETKEEKRENVEELVSKAIEWQEVHAEGTLAQFLEEIALVSSTDSLDESKDRVNLMTLHNAKGLEFDTAILAGLEEDLFPHINSKANPEQVEEERRLFYVGITRAKKLLFLTWARQRFLWGGSRGMNASRFLYEIPKDLLQTAKMTSPAFTPYRKVEAAVDEIPREELFIGETVLHPTFGIGRIESIKDTSLGKTYEILFQKDGSLKKLVAKYAPLKSLSSTTK